MDIIAPQTYSILWLGLALLIAALVGVWIYWAFLSTRGKAVLPDPPAPAPPAPMDRRTALDKTLERIDEAENAAARGERSPAEAHSDISFTVREYVHTVSGLDLRSATLAEVRALRTHDVERLLEVVYPAVFRADRELTVQQTARVAREVVMRW